MGGREEGKMGSILKTTDPPRILERTRFHRHGNRVAERHSCEAISEVPALILRDKTTIHAIKVSF